jgi:hypothetical protein
MRSHGVILPGIIATLAIGTASFNHWQISILQRENRQLQTIADEADRFDVENQHQQITAPASKLELEKLRAEITSLHKLRAEVQRLRSLEKESQPLRSWNTELNKLATQSANSKSVEPMPFIATSELRSAGRSTPEAALQSLLFALREGDLDQVSACVAPVSRPADPYPNYLTTRISNFWADPSWTSEDKLIELKSFASHLNSFRIVEQNPVGSEKVELTLQMTALDPSGNLQDLTDVKLEATLIDAEWKIRPGPQP